MTAPNYVFRPRPPLSKDSVEWLFSKLSLRYGSPFADRWKDVNLDDVKDDWSRELAPLNGNRAAVNYALANLPDKPPTVIEFKRLCLSMPGEQAALHDDTPVRGPNEAERAKLAELREWLSKPVKESPRAWAYRLLEDHRLTNRHTPTAVAMATAAVERDHLGEISPEFIATPDEVGGEA